MNKKVQALLDVIQGGESQSAKNRKVKNLITNLRIPLEDRWELYTEAVNSNYLSDEDTFYLDLDEVGLDLEDVGYCGENRHGVYDYWGILDLYSERDDYDVEVENKIKEIILKDGSSSWTYDW